MNRIQRDNEEHPLGIVQATKIDYTNLCPVYMFWKIYAQFFFFESSLLCLFFTTWNYSRRRICMKDNEYNVRLTYGLQLVVLK